MSQRRNDGGFSAVSANPRGMSGRRRLKAITADRPGTSRSGGGRRYGASFPYGPTGPQLAEHRRNMGHRTRARTRTPLLRLAVDTSHSVSHASRSGITKAAGHHGAGAAPHPSAPRPAPGRRCTTCTPSPRVPHKFLDPAPYVLHQYRHESSSGHVSTWRNIRIMDDHRDADSRGGAARCDCGRTAQRRGGVHGIGAQGECLAGPRRRQ
jgi:hypothetical protein